jgi:CheY-like chemotaxis protein
VGPGGASRPWGRRHAHHPDRRRLGDHARAGAKRTRGRRAHDRRGHPAARQRWQRSSRTPPTWSSRTSTCPRWTASALTQTLRADSRFRGMPILVLTTEATDAMKARGRAVGATGWLVKPFHPDTLRRTVGACWSRRVTYPKEITLRVVACMRRPSRRHQDAARIVRGRVPVDADVRVGGMNHFLLPTALAAAPTTSHPLRRPCMDPPDRRDAEARRRSASLRGEGVRRRERAGALPASRRASLAPTSSSSGPTWRARGSAWRPPASAARCHDTFASAPTRAR